jgi:hypothetical protein
MKNNYRKLLIPFAAAILIACALPLRAEYTAEGELPDDRQVRKAIDTMFTDPFSSWAAEAQNIVLDYSQGSDKIKVVVARGLGFYPDTKYTDMLLAHYIAGVVKFGLDKPKQAADEQLGAEAGLKAVLDLYKKIRGKEASFYVPELDAAEVSVKNGKLSIFTGEALARAKKERGA